MFLFLSSVRVRVCVAKLSSSAFKSGSMLSNVVKFGFQFVRASNQVNVVIVIINRMNSKPFSLSNTDTFFGVSHFCGRPIRQCVNMQRIYFFVVCLKFTNAINICMHSIYTKHDAHAIKVYRRSSRECVRVRERVTERMVKC